MLNVYELSVDFQFQLYGSVELLLLLLLSGFCLHYSFLELLLPGMGTFGGYLEQLFTAQVISVMQPLNVKALKETQMSRVVNRLSAK